jgi:prepilin-type N-terminal cleavage/methylation domain-containing protein
MMRARGEHGFTLVELLVTMAISVIVFGATLTALDVFQNHNRFDLLRNEAQDNARNAIDRLARELRNVAAPTTGYFGALEQASSYSITFQTIDSAPLPNETKNASNAMRVRYCLNDTTPSNEILWRQVKRWTSEKPPALPAATSCPDLTANDWDSSAQLAQYVTNENGGQSRSAFIYGPSGASEVSQITTAEPTLFIDVNPGHRPGETQLTSALSLRNVNRQPIAAFTATQVNGHVKLNASESLDPGGLALSYKWWDGATVLPANDAQQYETPGELVSKSSHTFKLEVTNPGGLSNSTSQTVVMK